MADKIIDNATSERETAAKSKRKSRTDSERYWGHAKFHEKLEKDRKMMKREQNRPKQFAHSAKMKARGYVKKK